MNLNEKLGIEIDQDKSNNDNNIESNNKISIENGINDNNRNQSDESIKTTEYSSEAGELILKYIKSSCKAHHYYKNNKDMIRDIRGLKLGKKYAGLMSWLINRAFKINSGVRGNVNTMDSKTNKNKSILMKTLYDVDKDTFLSCFV